MESSRIGRYIVEKEIGKGGMGTVYAAQDPYMKRRVAIKMMARDLSEDPFFRARFQAEAQVIAGLEHAYVVPVYDFGEHDGQQYIVMRYMPNNSLSYWLKDGPLPLSDCVMVLERMAEALDEAHSRDLVHRDFKPANILFDRQGGAYLADFGLVKIITGNPALSGRVLAGTIGYMSPEQVLGEESVDGRADVYAMGVTLFEMLTGQLPFHDEVGTKVMMAHVYEPVPSALTLKPDLDPRVDAIIMRAMAKEPDGRYSRGTDLVDELMGISRTILTRRARRRWTSDDLTHALDALGSEPEDPPES
jgi:serine/threonine protein kinase